MNPVLASNVISLGKALVEKITPPQPAQLNGSSKSFSTELNKVTKIGESSCSLSSLRADLLQDPEVESFISANPHTEIYFQKRADGSTQILSSSGSSLSIDKDSPTNQLITDYVDRCFKEGKNLSPHRPGSVLFTR